MWYICICHTSITRRAHGSYYGFDLKKEIVAMAAVRLVNDEEENHHRFEAQREEHWILTWSIAVRERLLELFCD